MRWDICFKMCLIFSNVIIVEDHTALNFLCINISLEHHCFKLINNIIEPIQLEIWSV